MSYESLSLGIGVLLALPSWWRWIFPEDKSFHHLVERVWFFKTQSQRIDLATKNSMYRNDFYAGSLVKMIFAASILVIVVNTQEINASFFSNSADSWWRYPLIGALSFFVSFYGSGILLVERRGFNFFLSKHHFAEKDKQHDGLNDHAEKSN